MWGNSSKTESTRTFIRHVVTRWYRAPELILLQDRLAFLVSDVVSLVVQAHRTTTPRPLMFGLSATGLRLKGHKWPNDTLLFWHCLGHTQIYVYIHTLLNINFSLQLSMIQQESTGIYRLTISEEAVTQVASMPSCWGCCRPRAKATWIEGPCSPAPPAFRSRRTTGTNRPLG